MMEQSHSPYEELPDMAKEDTFDHESLQDVQSVQKYLKLLSDGFANRKITFDSEKEHLTLHPRDLIEMEVSARKKGDKEKISIKISWKEIAVPPDPGDLEIHS